MKTTAMPKLSETARDEVMEEVWHSKDMLSAKFNHDISQYLADARKREQGAGISTVNLQRRESK